MFVPSFRTHIFRSDFSFACFGWARFTKTGYICKFPDRCSKDLSQIRCRRCWYLFYRDPKNSVEKLFQETPKDIGLRVINYFFTLFISYAKFSGWIWFSAFRNHSLIFWTMQIISFGLSEESCSCEKLIASIPKLCSASKGKCGITLHARVYNWNHWTRRYDIGKCTREQLEKAITNLESFSLTPSSYSFSLRGLKVKFSVKISFPSQNPVFSVYLGWPLKVAHEAIVIFLGFRRVVEYLCLSIYEYKKGLIRQSMEQRVAKE